MNLPVDRAYVRDLARELVAVDSVNPSLAPGSAGEAEVAALVARRMEALGLEVRVLEGEPGRPSVVGIRRGAEGSTDGDATADGRPGADGGGRADSERGRSLLLNAHLDTVGVEGMERPFEPRVEGDELEGRLYGRGAYDMKGALAACLGAVKTLDDAGVRLAGDLVVAAVADEEHASRGTREVLEAIRTDGAVVTEPTGLGVCLAHKGFVWLEVETEGRAAHGSRFREGVDANLRMGRVLAALDEERRRVEEGGEGASRHPLLGPGSLHAGLLRGGTAPSVYAARSTLTLERRTLPGETAAEVEEDVRRILGELRASDPDFRATVRTLLEREPFETSRDAEVVRAVAGAVHAGTGQQPRYVGEGPWMDAALLAAAGVETVVIGPTGGGAHADREWVELSSLYALAEILARTAVDYCGSAASGG